MKIETLSNHPAEQLELREHLREEKFQNDIKTHQAACAEIESRYRSQRDRFENSLGTCRTILSKSWRARNPIGMVRGAGIYAFTALFGRPRKTSLPPEPTKETPDQQDAIWEAGMRGEDAVVEALAGRLDDSWICLKGFHCRHGEIDLILVGPAGIVAVEVKSIKGHITCNQDSWTRDIYDNYGNCVDRDLLIHDKGGRSPAQQLHESATFLSERLKSKNVPARIRTVVLFSNPKAVLKSVENATVDEVVLLKDWDPTQNEDGTPSLNSKQVEASAESIRNLHQKDCRNGVHKKKQNFRTFSRNKTDLAACK